MGVEVRVGWILLFQSQVGIFSCKQWSVLQLAAILNSSCLFQSRAGFPLKAKWKPVVLVSLWGGQLWVFQQWEILLGKTNPKSYFFSLSVSCVWNLIIAVQHIVFSNSHIQSHSYSILFPWYLIINLFLGLRLYISVDTLTHMCTHIP